MLQEADRPGPQVDAGTGYVPVKQLFRHAPAEGVWGDCFRTCLASLLGMPADAVPHFMDRGVGHPEADQAIRRWLADRGLVLIELPMLGEFDDILQTFENFNPGIRFMLSGYSRTGCDRVVICQSGRIIHDPSLTDAGIIGPCQGSNPPLYWVSFLAPAAPHADAG